ncbi:MAG: hypothetical protein LBL66_06095 [Clostridiales bacterium]|jgi:hypothetical protein|nr:hypothetical protein [Clostridiales bacterium]
MPLTKKADGFYPVRLLNMMWISREWANNVAARFVFGRDCRVALSRSSQ